MLSRASCAARGMRKAKFCGSICAQDGFFVYTSIWRGKEALFGQCISADGAKTLLTLSRPCARGRQRRARPRLFIYFGRLRAPTQPTQQKLFARERKKRERKMMLIFISAFPNNSNKSIRLHPNTPFVSPIFLSSPPFYVSQLLQKVFIGGKCCRLPSHIIEKAYLSAFQDTFVITSQKSFWLYKMLLLFPSCSTLCINKLRFGGWFKITAADPSAFYPLYIVSKESIKCQFLLIAVPIIAPRQV